MTLSLSNTLNSGISALQDNDYEKAEALFQSVLALQADNVDALHLLGILKIRQGLKEEGEALLKQAILLCLQALEKEPNNDQLNLLLAYLYIDLQKWKEAEQAFRQALQSNQGLTEAYNGLGSIYFNQGQVQRAHSMFYQALKKDENNIEALYNQGIVLRGLGQLNEAQDVLSKAVSLAPTHISALASLGLTLQELDKKDEAKTIYKRVLKLSSGNSLATHMLSAIEGDTTAKAPNDFVSQLFDAYAPAYEQHLQETLDFQAPELITAALKEHCPDALPFSEVLDLGCGTGLMAKKLGTVATYIDGVDLSSKMLRIAASKNLYRSLKLGDIENYFIESQNKYDCCIASDVFIYVGDLEQTFLAVNQCLNTNGVFIFTTENSNGEDYALLDSGRYAHSASYISQMASASGLQFKAQIPVKIRKEEGCWLDGYVHIFIQGPC